MSFEIVANYQKHGYSLPSQASNDLVPSSGAYTYHYPRDVYFGNEWTDRTASISMYDGRYDDTYSNVAIPIGFNWGWGGVTYTQWYLNTNGKMLFALNSASGGINPSSSDTGICAYAADLWFDKTLALEVTVPISPGFTQFGVPTWSTTPSNSNNDLTPTTLLNSYGVLVENYNGFVRLKPSPYNIWQYNPTIEMLGYVNTSGAYQPQVAASGTIDNFKYNVAGQSGYEGMGNLYSFPLKTYNDGLVTTIPFSSMASLRVKYVGPPKPPSTTTYGVWDYSRSWVDNGVTHDYYTVVVYTGGYGNVGTISNRNTDHSYRISLYKAGASQRFSISLATDSARSVSNLECGPYPWAANDSTLRAKVDYSEQSWYSEDNGTTWFRYAPSGVTTYSTVTQMAPPQSWTSTYGRLGPNLARLDPVNNVSNFYENTPITTINDAPWYEYSHFSLGLGVVNTMMRMIVNNPAVNPAVNATDAEIEYLLNRTYAVGSGKSSIVFSFKDVTKDGVFDLSDSIDLTRIINGLAPNDSDSYDGYSRILKLIVERGDDGVYIAPGGAIADSGEGLMAQFIAGGYLVANKNSWSYAWNNKWILPGVKGVPPTKANLSTTMYNNLGAIAKNTIVPLDGAYVANKSIPTIWQWTN